MGLLSLIFFVISTVTSSIGFLLGYLLNRLAKVPTEERERAERLWGEKLLLFAVPILLSLAFFLPPLIRKLLRS